MKELDFLKIISEELTDCSFIGNDCAYLSDIGIYVTQDALVENVHFSLDYTSPFLLGRKSLSVNVSDIAAAFAKPEYASLSLSLPKDVSDDFVREFYRGLNDAAAEYGVKITGGDITASSEIMISVCLLGKKVFDFSTARNFLKPGDYVFSTGSYGASSAGFYGLSHGIEVSSDFLNAHLNPRAKIKEVFDAASFVHQNIAAIDTSDGFADALIRLASASNVDIEVRNVPVSEKVLNFAEKQGVLPEKFVLWGGEDYEVIFAVPEGVAEKISHIEGISLIGRACRVAKNPKVFINFNNRDFACDFETLKTAGFNHFGADKHG